MTIIELLKFHRELLEKLSFLGINTGDYRLVDLYQDYETMAEKGEKTTYIVSLLSERYDMCERKVYATLKRLKSTAPAVQSNREEFGRNSQSSAYLCSDKIVKT